MLRRAFYWVRVVSLTALFAGAFVLYLWSKRDDPRFYRFLQTPTGRLLSRAFHWHALPMDAVVKEKPREQMTAEELEVLHKLEAELAAQGLSPSATRLPPVTYRDICYKMELPDMHFFKAEPYTFLTDESYFSVLHAVSELQTLHRQFRALFGSLIDQAREHNDIQVLFFGNEERYRSYQRQTAEDLEYAVGFYSPVIDRLVVFNQARGVDIEAIQKSISNREADFRAAAQSEDQEKEITEWRKRQDQRIEGFAEAQTRATIRHEGAHQLFYTYGVHSKHRAENDWLIEGLACYCETDQPGDLDISRVRAVQNAIQRGRLIPLGRLLSTRGGFQEVGNDRIGLAYSEAWSLVLYLMQPKNRARFFEYIEYIRNPANLAEIQKTERLVMLAKFLDASPPEFERRWIEYVGKL